MTYVRFGKTRINYNIVKSSTREKTEIVVVGKRKVNVLAPASKSENVIHNIVKLNSRWIYQKQLRMDEKDHERLTYLDGSKLPYLGKKYSLSIFTTSDDIALRSKKQSFFFQKGKFVANVLDPEPKMIKQQYEEWLEKQTQLRIQRMVSHYANIIQLNPEDLKIRLKSQKKRVGSLGRNLVINFNRNILRLPTHIIEYIIVHELCHVHIPNHSKKYWQLLESAMSDYKKRKEWLEKNKELIS